MLYIYPGIVIGALYALLGGSITLTYSLTGVINLAVGATAYATAYLFYHLITVSKWALAPAVVLCLLAAPIFGLVIWAGVFRHIENRDLIVQLTATIGIAVALPALMEFALPTENVYQSPGIVPNGFAVLRIGSFNTTRDQLAAVIGAVVLLGGLILAVEKTRLGLSIRAVVDRPGLAAGAGINTTRLSAFSWILAGFLTGAAGHPAQPAAPAGSLHLHLAVGRGAERGPGRAVPLPDHHHAGRPGARRARLGDHRVRAAGQRDRERAGARPAVLPAGRPADRRPYQPEVEAGRGIRADRSRRLRQPRAGDPQPAARAVGAAARPLCSSPSSPAVCSRWSPCTRFNGYWTAALAAGIAFAVTFLSFTISTGNGGVLCLGQAGIAAIGAIVAGRLASDAGLGLPLSMVIAVLCAAVCGVVLGAVGTRLDQVGFALVTLAFALFCETFAFNLQALIPLAGVNYPNFQIGGLNSSQSAILLGAIIFAVLAIGVSWFRRSRFGRVSTAIRGNPIEAESLGVNVRAFRVGVFALGSAIAGLGGGLIGIEQGNVSTSDFALLTGLVWLAVVVTIGVRSSGGALVAGLMFAIAPAAFELITISGFGNLPTVLFGLGAIGIARDPRGFLAQMSGNLQKLIARPEPPNSVALASGSAASDPVTVGGGSSRD